MNKVTIRIFFLLFSFQFVNAQSAPNAVSDEYSTLINNSLSINNPGVLSNDSDPDNDVITVISFSINNINYNANETAQFAEGNLNIASNGSFVFNPTVNFIGNLPVISYTISDGRFTGSTNLFLSVTLTPEPPIANDDTYSTISNIPLIVDEPGILANDTDADNDVITVISFSINNTDFNADETAQFAEGNINIASNGSFVFNPVADYTGSLPLINYTISDGVLTSTANLNLSVILPPEPPIANDDTFSTLANIPLQVNTPGLLENDTDIDTDVLSVISYSVNNTNFNAGETAILSEGNLNLVQDGSFSFFPAPNYTGFLPPISYTITDGTFTRSASLNLSVLLPPEPPVAKDDYDTVDINTQLNVNAPGVMANDTDANIEDNLTITSFQVDGINYNAGETANTPQGRISINIDGSYTFIPIKDYTGIVLPITYILSDGTFTSSADLLLSVEPTEDLLEVELFTSCNQGYTVDGEYKIRYTLIVRNRSNARDYHEPSFIKNIDIVNNLENVFGLGCVVEVDNITIRNNNSTIRYNGNIPFPNEYSNDALNPGFTDTTSSSIFNDDAIQNLTLYPKQNIYVDYCVTVNPICNGRPSPTPSGSGIDFNNIIEVKTNRGNLSDSLLYTDFHTTEAVVAAGLYVPEFNNTQLDPPGVINPDGTYDYTNTVIITNEGTATANNVNFNMGLEQFIQSGVNFTDIVISQVSGPTVNINPDYDGNTETTLLTPNNSLAAGETAVLQIFYVIGPYSSSSYINFNQQTSSQTQGLLDGFDESTPANRRLYSFVTWSDNLGDHTDRYYLASSPTATITSANQCLCTTIGMRFLFTSESSTNKIISNVDKSPNGILEQDELTFQISITNTSESVQLNSLQLQDDLNSICSGKIINVSKPFIQNSTASTNPNLNPNYDGISDINIFDGTSGLLKKDEVITVEFKVLLAESCNAINSATFTALNPLGGLVQSQDGLDITTFTDSDNDGIPNDIDLDDDNDTIPDILEANGLDPLSDNDFDFIPNYRDTDFGIDANSDGIIDLFDFDNDGVPNHFDLDSDNDGILDIVEAGNSITDTNSSGRTNNTVGSNGLDNTIETSDDPSANINYIMPNTDANGNPDFMDIDADDDGIVDNIEGQPTNNYLPPNNIFSNTGIDTAYPTGINPVDTENDTIQDYIDINSDNDIRDDLIEGWDLNSDGTPEIIPLNRDADNDGLDDAFDSDNFNVNPSNGQTPLSFPNFDNVDNPERDWREIIAIFVIITDVSEIEGTDFTFTLTLVTKNNNDILIESAFPIDISFSTLDGTDTTTTFEVAIAPFDYTDVSNLVLTIPPLTTSSTFTIETLDDPIYENTERFTLVGTITSDNTINTELRAVGNILDNEDRPSISLDNSRGNEGEDLLHTVSLSHPSSTPISLSVYTIEKTAIAPEDYTAILQDVNIEGTIDPSNANTEVSFNISTNLDNLNEADEEFITIKGLMSTNNVGTQDLVKTATIVDIDPNPLVVIDNVSADEGSALEFTISLLNANSELMQNYLPININLETFDNTTFAGQDYTSLNQTFSFPAFTSTITQVVETIDDRLNEDTESLFLQGNINPLLVANTVPIRGEGTIIDNDYPNLFTPNNDGKSDFFKISGIENYPNFKLIIVNRQGNQVYNYSNNGRIDPIWWDGTYNGNPAPTGVYYYTLDFNDPDKKPITNFIQLVR